MNLKVLVASIYHAAARRIKSQIVLLIISFCTGLSAAQNPGSLDPSFGDGGLIYPFAGGGVFFAADDVAVQADGKIVISGVRGWVECYYGGGSIPACSTYVARLLPNGGFDPTFGSGGEVNLSSGEATGGSNLVIQPDGKIVVVGSYDDRYIFRLLSNGNLDPTFDGDGRVMFNDLLLGDVAVQPDGKIVLAGWLGEGMAADFAVARLNADGSFDTSFGVAGISRTEFGSLSSRAHRVLVQPDGRIVALGVTPDGLALARYNENGSLDISFGNQGKVISNILPDKPNFAVQGDGKLVVAGSGSETSVLMRFERDGSVDASFGTGGTAYRPGLQFSALAIQSNGRIIVGGANANGAHALARYLANGAEDTSFGANGVTSTEFPSHGAVSAGGEIRALSIQPDGRIIGAGSWLVVYCGENCIEYLAYPAVARYIADSSTPFDFDGDRRSDIAVFRPSDSVWYLNRSTQGFFATQFGLPTDNIVPADYDGDGKADIAVYRDGTWWINKSTTNTVVAISFGLAGDIPVPADYTGDGRDEMAVYRSGQWWTLDLSNGQSSLTNFGHSTDKPAPADYDGDGRVDQAVYRNGEWHLNRSMLGYTVVSFGLPSDKPVVGDYDGDSKADLAVYRGGTWYLQQSTAGFSTFNWGLATDIPVPGDYDGDGKTDASVFRNGTWYQLKSTGGISIQQFGLSGDRPLAASLIN